MLLKVGGFPTATAGRVNPFNLSTRQSGYPQARHSVAQFQQSARGNGRGFVSVGQTCSCEQGVQIDTRDVVRSSKLTRTIIV
jgi:hypothetical protein